MKNRFILPVILVFVLVVSSFSPYIVRLFQNKDEISLYVQVGEKKAINLKKGDFILYGKYLNEPILWEVLNVENGKTLIMTHHLITFKAFDVAGKDDDFHNVDSEKYGSSDWNVSTLKQWLNSEEKTVNYSHCPPTKDTTFKKYNAYDNESGFLYIDNFTEAEKNVISEDGVFILSQAEMIKYLSTNARKKTCTTSCISQNNAPYMILKSTSQWYWTRSSISTNNVSVASVTSGGTFYKSLAYDSTMGVSPALYLNLTSASAYGNGTKDEPYIMF